MSEWFAHCRTLDEARLEYRRLCFEHHPDHGGDTLVMQAINAAYNRFKLDRLRARPAPGAARPNWRRPRRERPADVAPEHERWERAAPRPTHSRDYVHTVWASAPWRSLADGNLRRDLLGHSVVLVRHPAPKYQGAWFVLLDNAFSPYFYDSRPEAEQAAFDLLYDKVKYQQIS